MSSQNGNSGDGGDDGNNSNIQPENQNQVLEKETKENEEVKEPKNRNRGTGAGGANAPINGGNFEAVKDISTEYKIISIFSDHQIFFAKKVTIKKILWKNY